MSIDVLLKKTALISAAVPMHRSHIRTYTMIGSARSPLKASAVMLRMLTTQKIKPNLRKPKFSQVAAGRKYMKDDAAITVRWTDVNGGLEGEWCADPVTCAVTWSPSNASRLINGGADAFAATTTLLEEVRGRNFGGSADVAFRAGDVERRVRRVEPSFDIFTRDDPLPPVISTSL